MCAPIAVPAIQSEQARDEICRSASEIRGANEICLAADEIHQRWVSFGSLNRNELNARVEPCGTFSPHPEGKMFCLWSGIFLFLDERDNPSVSTADTSLYTREAKGAKG